MRTFRRKVEAYRDGQIRALVARMRADRERKQLHTQRLATRLSFGLGIGFLALGILTCIVGFVVTR